MKQISKRLLGAFLAIIMVVTMVPNSIKASATNASTQGTITTGSIITYGSYPQTNVTDAGLLTALNAQTLCADNTVTYNGSKYLKQTDWFKYEPIQWRVLSNTNGELFVMAEKILDSRAYNQVDTNVTWETCTLRTWLNNDFYNTAFNATERAKIKTTNVVNENNPWWGTSGGNNTSDKLFLLSYSEAMNPAYGFIASTGSDTARIAQGTDYAKSQGLNVSDENSYWWLRSPIYYLFDAGYVVYGGGIGNDCCEGNVSHANFGARPAFKINLSSDIFTSKAGSSCIINCLDNFVYGLTPGIPSLENYAETAPGYNLEYVTTVNGFGTGTVLNVTLNEATIESYTIVIYGDVNGDGNIDSIDAGNIVDYQNYMITWDPLTDAAKIKAADLNGDGNVDSIDAGIAVDSQNYMSFINQSTGIGAPIEPIDGTVVITGLPKFGNTLTADTSNITPSGATLTYVWKSSGVVIGTDKTYIVTANDIGKSITVTVTGFGGFSGGVRSAAVTATPAIISGTVTATGTAKFGEMLTADTTNIDPTAATLTYQWKRGEVNIGSGSTYTIAADDIGQPITVTVTGTGVYEGSIASTAVTPAKADAAAPSPPTLKTKTFNSVTLNAVAGQEYKIESGAWQTSAVFTGLNKNTAYNFYTRIAETATHNASGSSTALSVTTNKATISGTVSIAGNANVGATLNADITCVLPNGATLTYVWKEGSIVIGTGSTYTIIDDDIGEAITVTVTGTGDYMGSLTSASTGIVS